MGTVVPTLAAVLAAASVLLTAGVLSSRPRARRGELAALAPTPLPPPVGAALDMVAVAAGPALRAVAALAVTGGLLLGATAALHTTLVVVWLLALGLALTLGVPWRPTGLPQPPAPTWAPALPPGPAWGAALACAALAAALTAAAGQPMPTLAALAVLLLVSLGAHAAARDPFVVLTGVAGGLAWVRRIPVGSSEPTVRWALASPLPPLMRLEPAPGTALLLAVLIGVSAGSLAPPPATPAPGVTGLLAGVAGAALAVRLTLIRPYLLGAGVAVTAGWTLAAQVRWGLEVLDAPPVWGVTLALGLLLLGHLTAVAAAHRAALARHDPRAARAVQFPLRSGLTLSAALGAAWLTL